MKYAAVAINKKLSEDDTWTIRRVLIEYKEISEDPNQREYFEFYGSRLVDLDNYFKADDKSHKYQFDDSGYVLVSSSNVDSFLSGEHRTYHFVSYLNMPILFECNNDAEAIKRFQERDEKHD